MKDFLVEDEYLTCLSFQDYIKHGFRSIVELKGDFSNMNFLVFGKKFSSMEYGQ
jgi:hypothetical protein